MAAVDQLIEFIRFQLAELGAKNAHHEFEHLCRHLTRRRICSNVHPATGPVSAGGDQGRDFETFRTYLGSSPLANSAFVGLASNRPLAFACSLQQDILPKIRADVAAIAGAGQPVEGIHYFCTANVPVARRHEVQAWAKDQHGVHVEIHDGPAIAEMLSDRDVFWIASRYLGVPAEMYPAPASNSADSWYEHTITEWRADPRPALTFANFAMVKAGTRRATSSTERSNDLPFWLNALKTFLSEDAVKPLHYRAIYEVAVASLRGLGTMEGLEERLRSYFDAAPQFTHIADLEDASCLVAFAFQAMQQHGLSVTIKELLRWIETLVEEIDQRCADAQTPGSHCQLLELRGHLEFTRGLGKQPEASTKDEIIAGAVQYWTQAAEAAEDAPLFPLQRFADRLVQLTEFIGDDPGYELLTRRVDDLLSRRTGDAAAASQARMRAHAFYESGRLLRAIAELHEAKVRWYASETLQSSTLAMLFIAGCYRDLGLMYASRYYALAAAHVAGGSDDPNVRQVLPKALAFAAECDYMQGAWHTFFRLMDLAVATHWHFVLNPDDFETHPSFQQIWLSGASAVAVTERINPVAGEAFMGVMSTWGPPEWLQAFIPAARAGWEGFDPEQTLRAADEQLRGAVLGDLMSEREVAWEELGITWRVRWKNTDETTMAVEQFIAVLQIALTDFAQHDLHLLRTEIDIEAAVDDIAEPIVTSLPSNEGRKWQVLLSNPSTGDDDSMIGRMWDIFGAASEILREASLLDDERFINVLEAVVKGGVLSKLLVARSYESLVAEFLGDTDEMVPSLILRPLSHEQRRAVAPAHPELEWIDRIIPGYSRQEATQAALRRYIHAKETLPLTLARLRESTEFHATAETLKQDGWHDWHILLTVGNQTWNYRTSQYIGPFGLLDPDNETWRQYAFQQETIYSPKVPMEEYSEDKLRTALRMTMISTLTSFGLECHQVTPDLPAIEEFLARRCNYWVDDWEHEDLLGLVPSH